MFKNALICALAGALSLVALTAGAQTAQRLSTVDEFVFTNFPLYGGVVTPDDAVDLTNPGVIRADADGVVKAICQGSSSGITLTLVAGEYFPCVVRRVYDTGSDNIVIHVFY